MRSPFSARMGDQGSAVSEDPCRTARQVRMPSKQEEKERHGQHKQRSVVYARGAMIEAMVGFTRSHICRSACGTQ